jgi:hypothetical protein
MKPCAFLVALLVSCVLASIAQAGAVIREPGAIYLEDFMEKPVRLATVAQAPIFYQSDMGRYLGTLRKGQLVELQAVSPNAYRIRGQAQQGQVAGWIDPKFLAPLKKEFLSALKQNADRQAEVSALIARNEVAINMTPQEVTASLGKPAKTTSRLDAKGREEVWEFVKFDRVPQSVTAYDNAGRLVTRTVYVKVPVGKLAVAFENNLVSSLEQTEGTFARDARVKIFAAPFIVAY